LGDIRVSFLLLICWSLDLSSKIRDKLRRKQYDDWLSEQRLRETKELIGGEVNLDTSEAQQFENVCRCGGIYLLETEELEKILDYVLIECSNCSLCLKIWKKPASELLA
jgi:hypothetical protein